MLDSDTTLLNWDPPVYCICDQGDARGYPPIYPTVNNTAVGGRSQLLSQLVQAPGPTEYNINLAGGRFNTTVCDKARELASSKTTHLSHCGALQLTPNEAYALGFPDCGDFLISIVNSVFEKSGGAKPDHKGRGYVDESSVAGGWLFVSYGIAVSFPCQWDETSTQLLAGHCNVPCPAVLLTVFSLSTTYASCPFRGSKIMRLSTGSFPASIIVRSGNTSDYYSNIAETSGWVAATEPVPATVAAHLDIDNDYFHDRFESAVHILTFCVALTLSLNLFVLISFFTSGDRNVRQRPYDLIAGMVLFESLLEVIVVAWAISGYPNDWAAMGVTITVVFNGLLAFFLAVAHDLVQQVRNPFKRTFNLKLIFWVVVFCFIQTNVQVRASIQLVVCNS